MPTLTGDKTRTLAGYVAGLLDYPRLAIAREVDFSHCRHGGAFDSTDPACIHCGFGSACRWLDAQRSSPSTDTPLDDLVSALEAAVGYLRRPGPGQSAHRSGCYCERCAWLREAGGFLRSRRHRT